MFRFRIGLALFILAIMAPILISVPTLQADQQSLLGSLKRNIYTKVLVDSKGTIHVLWIVPLLNHSVSAPGIWYSEYSPDGSDSIPPTLIRNSSFVQSADMALDKFDHTHITWAESLGFTGPPAGANEPSKSELYYSAFNSTNMQLSPTSITTPKSLVAWPSIVVDDNLTAHFVWSEVDLENDQSAGAYYAAMGSGRNLSQPILLDAFNRTLASIPRPSIAFNRAENDLHIAWVESDSLPGGHVVSSIGYAKLDLKWRNVTRLVVAKFNEPVEDASVTAGPAGNAYIVWQTSNESQQNNSVYVAQISRSGQVVFVKQLSPPNGRISSLGVVVSADSENNLYLVWYQPAIPATRNSPVNRTLTNISYLKLDRDGSLTQSKSEYVEGPLLAVTISTTGDVFAISQQGIVRVTEPTNSQGATLLIATVTVASLAGGAVASEELRYRMLRSVARISRRLTGSASADASDDAILRVLCRKPGLTLGDVRRLLPNQPPTLAKIATLESEGYVSSVRIGMKRRFYGSGQLTASDDPASLTYETIPLRIIHEIERNPGIWEAKLAQTLSLSQQIVHYHLRKLQNAKIVATESVGKRKLYRLFSSRNDHPDT